MSICGSIRTVTRRHEWVSDFFSVLAVIVLFASVGLGLHYQAAITGWVSRNVVLHTPLMVGAVTVDVLLVLGLLCLGSPRCEQGSCFRTFRGRRHGGPGIGSALRNWVHHMEHVGKKHR